MSDGSVIIDTVLNTKDFESGLSKMSSIASKGLSAITGAVKAVGTALAGAAAYSMKVGSDFEAQMSAVQAISGATGEEFDKLSEKAKQMGRDTKYTASEAGKAFEYMAQNGWKTEEMLNGIDGVMSLAAASGEDLASTADIVTVSLNAMKMESSDAGHFADVLAQVSADTSTNVAMLGDSFKYAAPLAGALGFNCEDVSVALGLMANAGIRSSQSGTSLRSILTNMAKPTEQMQGAMDRLGVTLTDSSGNMKSFHQIMLDLRSGFSKLSESEKVATAGALAGKYGMSGLLAIVNTSDDDFNKLTNSINNCEGAAQKMAETKLDNLQGQMTILKSSVESLGIEFYQSVGNPLTDVVREGISMVNSLTNAFKADGLEGMVVKLGDILGTIATQFANFLPTFIDVGVEVVNNFIDGLSNNSDQLANAGIKIVTSIVNGAKKIIPKVIDLGADIMKALLKSITGYSFDREIDKLADTIKNTLSNAFSFATKLIKPFLEVVGKLSEHLDVIGPAIIGVVSALKAYEIAITVAKTAQALFNGVCSANPYLLVASAIAGVIAIAGSYKLTQEDEYEEHNKLINKVNEHCDSYKKLGEQAEESMKKGFSDTSYLESLKKDLDGLVDANGKVKDGYQGRVDFICKELQDATGIEINQVDGVIQKYDELSKKIDDTIQKKKADIILEALKPQYQEALQNRTSNYLDLEDLEKQLKEEKEKLDEMTSTFGDTRYDLGDINKQKKKIKETESAIKELKGTIDDSEKDIKDYDKLTTLYGQKSYQTMYQMYSSLATGIKNGSEMTLDEARETLSKLRNAYAEALNDGNKDTASQLLSQYNQTMSELDPKIRETLINSGFNYGMLVGNSTANGINASSPNVENAINGLSNNYVVLANSSINASNQIIGKNGEVIGSLQNVTQNADGTRNGIANLNGTPINIKVHENGVISTLDGVLNKCREISGSAVTVEMRQRWTSNGRGGVYVPEGYATGTNNATRGVHLVGEEGPELVMFNGGESVLNASKTKSIYENLKNQIGKLMIESPDIISNFVNGISSHIDNFAKSITVNGTIKIDSINSQLNATLDEESIGRIEKAVKNGASNSKPSLNIDGKSVSKNISPYMSTDLAYGFNGRR